MKVKLKSKTSSDFRCKGAIRAEGKKASPAWCWREKVLKEDAWGKHTGVEIYSRVTGKLIGYFGHQREFVMDPAKAWTADKLNASLIPTHIRLFLNSAQSNSKYNRGERESLRAIIKAAKTSK